jgi:Zn-dependent M32 family carboxypeptidase
MKITDKEMKQAKYYEGYVDGINSVLQLLATMIENATKAFKKHNYKAIMYNIGACTKAIADVFDQANQRLARYLKQLAQNYQLEYNPDTEELYIDEDEQKIKKEEKRK